MNVVNHIVDRQHVSASNRDIIRSIWSVLRKRSRTRLHREARHRLYREALKRHEVNRELSIGVPRGFY